MPKSLISNLPDFEGEALDRILQSIEHHTGLDFAEAINKRILYLLDNGGGDCAFALMEEIEQICQLWRAGQIIETAGAK